MDNETEKGIFLKAQILEQLGQKQQAQRLYFKLMEDFPNSDYYNITKLKLGILN